MTKLKKYLLILLGSISLIIGIIGIFLPLLPTTPLILLSAFCYFRSSKFLYNWLINHKIIGKYIYNYITYRGIPKNTKIFVTTFLWTTLLISAIIIGNIYIRLLLILVGIGVTIHILSIKTINLSDVNILKDDIINADTKAQEENLFNRD